MILRPLFFLGCFAASVAAVVASPVAAQGVWPAEYANRMGGDAQEPPFVVSRAFRRSATRAVYFIEGDTLPVGVGKSIRGIAFRRDALHNRDYSGYSARIQVRVATIPDAQRSTVSLHRLLDFRNEVFDNNVSVPAARRASANTSFPLRIAFQRPWIRQAGDLLLDVRVEGPRGSLWRCDAVRLGDVKPAGLRSLGGGCTTSIGSTPHLYVEDSAAAVPGGRLDLLVEPVPAPPNGSSVLFLLGWEIAPTSLLVHGLAASCFLRVFPTVNLAAPIGDPTVTWYRSRLRLAVPAANALRGVRFTSQSLVFDNALSTRLSAAISQAVEIQIGTELPASSRSFRGRAAFHYGAEPNWRASASRFGPRNFVPVLEFF